MTLRPLLPGIDAGLVTVANWGGAGALWLWRSVFERHAPGSLQQVEDLIAPASIGAGTNVYEVSDELLAALTQAYDEAATPADVVIVAAASAYGEYMKRSAYVCQAGRRFRDDIRWMGFYADREIKPEIAAIQTRRDGIVLTESEIGRLQGSANEDDQRIGVVARGHLEERPAERGELRQIFLLSPSTSDETERLTTPIKNDALDKHGKPTAFTMGHRYVRLAALKASPATTSQIA